MKRFRLSKQMILLFTFVVTLCGVIYSGLLFQRMQKYAISQTYERLESYADLLRRGIINDDTVIEDDNFEFGAIRGRIIAPTVAQIDYTLNSEPFSPDLNELVNRVNILGESRGKLKNENGKDIYYFTKTELTPTRTFTILITNNEYIKETLMTVALQSIAIFAGVIVLVVIVIAIWSRYFVNRIHKLQNHIGQMALNNYGVAYIDNGKDEIANLANSIEQLRKQIEENEKTKQDMLQNVSHDFKTPISVIKNYAEAIGDGVADVDSTQLIIDQADLLKGKVNKLLQYNKLAYLDYNKALEPIDMVQVINSVANNYRYHSSIDLDLKLADKVFFFGFAENYSTVVENILDNAYRYAKTKIVIELKDKYLSIYNDGEPIDDKFIHSSFKAYEKGSKGQFGLGMSIVCKTLDFFDYNLTVQNEEIGVTFLIRPNDKEE